MQFSTNQKGLTCLVRYVIGGNQRRVAYIHLNVLTVLGPGDVIVSSRYLPEGTKFVSRTKLRSAFWGETISILSAFFH